MTLLVFTLLVFLAVGSVFLFVHLLMGKAIRPNKPEADKLTIYECGEPTVGSSWIQFDLRFYVVALLFLVFDVEVAFFFPWATVFGQANALSRTLPDDERERLTSEFNAAALPPLPNDHPTTAMKPETAKSFAWLALADIGIFFGVLLMGFAYLWKRGDIDWVRSTTHSPPSPRELTELPLAPEVGPRPRGPSVLSPANTQ